MNATFNYKSISRSHPRMKAFSAVKKEIDSYRKKPKKIRGYLGVLGKFYRFLKPKGIILTDLQGFKIFLNGDDEVMVPYMLAYGVHEPQETELIRSIIKPSMTVLDVGANLGYYSLIIAKALPEKCKIYAFEPDPDNFELLTANIQVNHFTQVTAVPKAVSNKIGKLNLFKDADNFGAHSMSFQNLPAASEEHVEVDAITLDDFVRENNLKVDLIKMDIEGHEEFVFDGARELFKEPQLKMLLEFWPKGLTSAGSNPLEVLKKIESFGFVMDVLVANEIKRMDTIADVLRCAEENTYVNLYLHKEK